MIFAFNSDFNIQFAGLSKRTTTEGLRDAFAKFGEVVHGIVFSFLFLSFRAKDFKLLISLPIAARVVTDRVSGFSKGFGFVRYATTEEAAKGIEGMDGKVWLLYILS